MSSNAVIKVNVRNVAVGGAGVGEVFDQSDGNSDLLGITAFVPFSAVGEVVSARVLQHKKRYLNAQLLEVEQKSPERVAPECRYFTHCGGCELQHMSYGGQLIAKREMIRSALVAGRCGTQVVDKLKSIEPSSPYYYRRRVNLHIDSGGKVGFYRESSRSVVPVESCVVAVPAINALLKDIQDFGRTVQGKVSSLQLEADDQGVVAVIKSPLALGTKEEQTVLGTARKYFQNAVLMVGEKEVGGFGRQIIELPLGDNPKFTLRVPAGAFSQANWDVNRKLIARVVQVVSEKYGQQILDLYAGAGNFSLPLARAGHFVTAVESEKRLVTFGRESMSRLGLEKNLAYYDSSVEKFLAQEKKLKADFVLADPPRSGLAGLVSSFDFAPRFGLISCHLPSFVRDIKGLVDSGWEVETIEPFDMFAQTSYVEIFAALRRAV